MNDERPTRVTVDSLLAKFSQISYGELLHDDQRRRHLLATMMAESTNPILKELGEQLRDGVIGPRQLLSVPAYWAELQQGYRGLADIDLDQLDQQVDQIREQERAEAGPPSGPVQTYDGRVSRHRLHAAGDGQEALRWPGRG